MAKKKKKKVSLIKYSFHFIDEETETETLNNLLQAPQLVRGEPGFEPTPCPESTLLTADILCWISGINLYAWPKVGAQFSSFSLSFFFGCIRSYLRRAGFSLVVACELQNTWAL